MTSFLAGYWPEREKRLAAEAESTALRSRTTALDDRVRAAQLHVDLLNLIDAIEAMNYGQAQTQSSALFDRVRSELGNVQNPELRTVFDEMLRQRDAVTGALSRGDAAALGPLSGSERKLRQLIGKAPSAT